ncbi:MAG: InlB B-repeat-containing protein [Acutalibacteraceae bacterium]
MKNQLKKTLSLIMAVFMLLSCWVWVAPEKAEAANTVYYVRILGYVYDDWSNGGSNSTVTVYFKDNNGTAATEESTSITHAEGFWNNGTGYDATVFEGYVGGFPTRITHWAKTSTLRTMGYNNIRIYVGADEGSLKLLYQNADRGFYIGGSSNNTETIWNFSVDNSTSDMPKPSAFDSAKGSVDVTAPSYDGAPATSGSVGLSYKDQYGVAWYNQTFDTSVTSGHQIKFNTKADGTGTNVTSYFSSTFAANTNNTLTVTPMLGAQTISPGNDTATVYAIVTFSSTNSNKIAVTVNIDKPTYTIDYDINAENAAFADGSPEKSDELTYGEVISPYPTQAVRKGYDFLGLTKTPQPDGYKLDVNQDKLGKNYLNGTQTIDTDGSTTWYAHWGATEVTATFRNADGQFIGTLPARYNRQLTHSDIYGSVDSVNEALYSAYTGTAVKWDANHDPVYEAEGRKYVFSHWRIAKLYDLDGNDITDTYTDPTAADTALLGNAEFEAVYTLGAANNYTVTFYRENGTVLDKKADYKYRDLLIFPESPTKAYNKEYSYEFAGWAEKAGTSGANSYIIYEDGLTADGFAVNYLDVNDDSLVVTVRGDKNYVPVFKATKNKYFVKFTYKVNGGAETTVEIQDLTFDDVIVKPDTIPNDYTANGMRYTFGDWKAGTIVYADGLTLRDCEARLTFNGTDNSTGLEFKPAIASTEKATYTIKFYDIDGNVINEDATSYPHGNKITVPTVDATVDRFETVEINGEDVDIYTKRYTFNSWNPALPENGRATVDADYYATYDEHTFAQVTYHDADGNVIGNFDGRNLENSLFVNESAIPALVETVTAEDGSVTTVPTQPAKADDVTATYTFKGWAASTDATDVIDLATATISSADMHLYPVYEKTLKEYTVKFLNGETEYATATYHYGDTVVLPETNPTMASDDTYNYTFRGWSPEVSLTCTGNAAYTAVYRRDYRYYKVTWFKDDGSVFSVANYTFNERINVPGTPAPTAATGDAGEGYTWALEKWVACDADGNKLDPEVVFTRGDRMPANALYFKPVYEKKADQKTVKFYDEDGTTLVSTQVFDYNTPMADVLAAAPQISKPTSPDKHFALDKWIYSDGTEIAEDAVITSDIEIKATFKEESHTFVYFETVVEPTCTSTGLVDMMCTNTACKRKLTDVLVAPIEDFLAPQGQVYIGSYKWTSIEYEEAMADDTAKAEYYSEIAYVNPKDISIASATDINNWSRPWNLDGTKVSGVNNVYYYLAEDVVADPDAIADDDWTLLFDYDEAEEEVLISVLYENGLTKEQYDAFADDNIKKIEIDKQVAAVMASYKVNATNALANLGLEDGKTYIIYVKLVDRACVATTDENDATIITGTTPANNTRIFSTGKFHYGKVAPTVTITGDGSGANFCTEATIAVNDDFTATEKLVVTLDGTAATLTDGKLAVTQRGIHTVTVIDAHGNITTKTFEIKGAHSNKQIVVAPTCTEDGSRVDSCTVCGYVSNVTVLDKLGHNYNTYIDVKGTCLADGHRTYSCSNGCGSTAVAKPGDFADGAAAPTFKEFTDAEIAAIKALAKTGHTWREDDDGNVIEVIEKSPTCIAAGSKYKQCSVCYYKEITEIPADAENGHKYYRPQTEVAPTCTTEGSKSKTCRYCGTKVENVETIPALGHDADARWTIITNADCTQAGVRVKYCTRNCLDENGDKFIVEREEIPALGHKWRADGEPYSEELEDGTVQWYQSYKCAVCGETKKEPVDGPTRIPATVTFKNGEEIFAVIGTEDDPIYVGDIITSIDVAEPETYSDDTYRYVFDCWVDSEGNKVTFPITVGADIADGATNYEVTYTAKFKAKQINFTVTYLNADGDFYRAVGYLKNHETYDTVEPPKKSSTSVYDYEFDCWTNETGTETYTDKITIDGANVTLKATYKQIPKTYKVTFLANDDYFVFDATAGQAFDTTDLNDNGYAINPAKAPTDNGHFVFKGWNKANQLSYVTGDIYTTPVFEEVVHTFTYTTISDATCTEAGKVEKSCTCGYKTIVEGTPALGHDWGNPTGVDAEGNVIIPCNRCDAIKSEKATYTITFKNGEDVVKTANYIEYGTALSTLVPADPTRHETNRYTYKFLGWATTEDAATPDVDIATAKVAGNVTYYAVFKESLRKYTVVFAFDAKNPIKTFTDVNAGTKIYYSAENAGENDLVYADIPVKAYNNNQHFTFDKWSRTEGTEVLGDLYITAMFTAQAHTYEEGDIIAATCETGEGTEMVCACGRSYVIETSDPLGHSLKEVERKEATISENGYVKYVCDRCGYEKTETLVYNDTRITIRVKVTKNGAAYPNVEIEVQDEIGLVETTYKSTDANGYATFVLDGEPSSYRVYAKINGERREITLTSSGEREFYGEYNYVVAVCTCACHRDNLWGQIFRFFHSILKMITGEYKCCNDPSPLYKS